MGAFLSSPLRGALLIVGLTSACSPLRGSTSPPSSETWVRKVLGGRADAVVVLRLDRARNDAVYGPVIRERTRDADIDAAFSSIDSVEVWGVADGANIRRSSWLVAVYALPGSDASWWQPLLRHLDGVRRLPSGTLEYTTAVAGSLVAVYGYPDGTLVGATGVAASRLTERARASTAPPSPTTWEREAILALYFGPHFYRLPDVPREGVGQGLQAVGAVIRSSERGDLAFAAGYDTVAHARAAHDLIAAHVPKFTAARAAAVRDCPPLAQLDLEFRRDGRTVRGYLGDLAVVLAAYRAGECR